MKSKIAVILLAVLLCLTTGCNNASHMATQVLIWETVVGERDEDFDYVSPGRASFLRIDKPRRTCNLSSSQGELEGAKPASNRIKCRAKPCSTRRAWSEANIFVPPRGTKITALFCWLPKRRKQPPAEAASREGAAIRRAASPM